MELNRLRGRLQMATRGHKLLKDKRDELMRQFIELVKENKRLRESIEGKLADSFANFLLASAVMSSETLEEALMYPTASINVEVATKNIMSVRVPEITLVRPKQPQSMRSITVLPALPMNWILPLKPWPRCCRN